MKRQEQLTDFGKKVKIKLIEMNMTQVDLAKQIGTSTVYLNRILYGDRSGRKYRTKIQIVLKLDINEKIA